MPLNRSAYGPILVLAAAAALAGCTDMMAQRAEREARINVFPDNYRADIVGAMRAYVADPTNIRDAALSDPAIRPLGGPNRYTACVRFNAKNGDGRYIGVRDVMAVFSNGRLEQFVELAPQPDQPSSLVQSREACAQAEYRPFPELQALRR
jgi:hypothetical protein